MMKHDAIIALRKFFDWAPHGRFNLYGLNVEIRWPRSVRGDILGVWNHLSTNPQQP